MVRLSDELGPVLTGRFLAAELRNRLESEAVSGNEIVLDFEGVELISPSFADELFAKLPREMVESGQIRFEHLDEDLTTLVHFVVQGRETR